VHPTTEGGRLLTWSLLARGVCRRPNPAYLASSARVRSLRSVDIPLARYSYIAQSMHFLRSLLEPCRASLINYFVRRIFLQGSLPRVPASGHTNNSQAKKVEGIGHSLSRSHGPASVARGSLGRLILTRVQPSLVHPHCTHGRRWFHHDTNGLALATDRLQIFQQHLALCLSLGCRAATAASRLMDFLLAHSTCTLLFKRYRYSAIVFS
jgi:hypothetical protein